MYVFPLSYLCFAIVLLGLVKGASIQCPDGKITCPEGKLCCLVDNQYECCDTQIRIEPFPSPLMHGNFINDSISVQNLFRSCNDFCNGICCSSISCCPINNAICCPDDSCCHNGMTCCPTGCCKYHDGQCCPKGGCCRQGKTCCDSGCCSIGTQCCGEMCCPPGAKCCSGKWCCKSSEMCDLFESCDGSVTSIPAGASYTPDTTPAQATSYCIHQLP